MQELSPNERYLDTVEVTDSSSVGPTTHPPETQDLAARAAGGNKPALRPETGEQTARTSPSETENPDYEAELARIEAAGPILIPGAERARIVRALDSLEGYIENSIESACFEGRPSSAIDIEAVREARREWREVQDLLLFLEAGSEAQR